MFHLTSTGNTFTGIVSLYLTGKQYIFSLRKMNSAMNTGQAYHMGSINPLSVQESTILIF